MKPDLLLVLVTSFVALAPAGRPGESDPVGYAFKKPPLNAMGIASLEDLRGKPVLISFWGTRSGPSISGGVPPALKVQDEYGDAIQVILVECQGATRDQYEAFAWSHEWMGTAAMWTSERPVQMTGKIMPESCLLDADGRIVMQGSNDSLSGKLDKAIAAEVKKSKKAPAGTPPALEKAWSAFEKGGLADALSECDKAGTDEAKVAREHFVSSAKSKVDRAQRLIDDGYLFEAEKLTDALAAETKGVADLEPLVAAQVARIASPEMATEREASKAVGQFFAQITAAKKKPFEAGTVQKAELLAKKHADTKSGERAARFVELSRVKPPS